MRQEEFDIRDLPSWKYFAWGPNYWSIFRNYEYKDSKFVDIIKDKIVIKKEVFEKLSGP